MEMPGKNAATVDEDSSAAEQKAFSEIAGHSRTVMIWTLISRITGFGRVAMLAAVLGPTFFGNLFQTTLLLPHTLCQLLMTSLMTAILAPHLVRLMGKGDHEAARRLACGFFGLAMLVFTAIAVLAALAAPKIVPLLIFAVEDPAVRAQQLELGRVLILTVAPQIPLYGIASIGMAVQQANRRYALSTAAPAFENLAFILVLVSVAMAFGVGRDVGEVTMAQVLALGLGSTTTIAIHAGVQWWGARRCGITLLPRAGWRDRKVRELVRMALPSSGNASLVSLTLLLLLIVASGIPGGAVAFHVANSVFNLPVALCARPIAAAQLPLLSLRAEKSCLAGYADLAQEGLRYTLFIAIPAGFVFLFLPELLALLVSFGRMRSEAGMGLVMAAIAGLGPAVIGQSVVVVSTSAAYARHDAVSPFLAMLLQASIVVAGLVPVFFMPHGPQQLFALGLVFSLATLAAAVFLHHRQPRAATPLLDRTLGRDLLAASLAVLSGYLVCTAIPHGPAALSSDLVAAMAGLVTAALVYIAFQYVAGSRQLRFLLESFGGRPGGHAEASP